jgi:hypothetical protein
MSYFYDDVEAELVVFEGYFLCLCGSVDFFFVGTVGVFAFVGVAGYVEGLF